MNTSVKNLSISFHGGYLCIEKPIFLDVKLIVVITGLPLAGIDPIPYLRKDQDTVISTKMKDKYDFTRDNRGFLITSINDHTVRFATEVLIRKLLRKMQSNKCIAGAVALADLCA